MSTNFTIFATARSGSTWMNDLLSRHPQLTVYGELFNPDPTLVTGQMPAFVASPVVGRHRRPFSSWKYLQSVFRGASFTGFKLLYAQARNFPEVVGYLLTHRHRMVHLVRANQLDNVISMAIVLQRLKRWQVLETDPVERQDLRVRLPAESLVDQLEGRYRKVAAARRFLRNFRIPHIEIQYEQLQADPAEFGRLWSFLEVADPGETSMGRFQKIRTLTRRETIENLSEVERALAGTRFAALLED